MSDTSPHAPAADYNPLKEYEAKINQPHTTDVMWFERGMTLRDFFAGQAMARLIDAIKIFGDDAPKALATLAAHAYAVADAMLAARAPEVIAHAPGAAGYASASLAEQLDPTARHTVPAPVDPSATRCDCTACVETRSRYDAGWTSFEPIKCDRTGEQSASYCPQAY